MAQGRLLGSREFILLWSLGGLSNAMRWLEVLAASLFTLDATGSQFAVAAVAAARSLPLVVMGAFAGVVADAFDRKVLLWGGMLLSAVSAGVIAALAFAGSARPWELFAASIVSGTVYGLEFPVRRRMTGESVAPALVSQAIALDSLTIAATRVAGPLLGGAAYQFLGLAGAFLLSVVVNLVATALGLMLRHTQTPRRLGGGAVLADLAEGVAAVRRSAVVTSVLAVTVAQNLFGYAYSSLVAPLGQTVFGVTPALVGVLAAAEPAGATLGGIALALGGTMPGRPVWLLLGGSAFFLAALALLPAAPWFWAACALLFAGGTGLALYTNSQTMIVLTEIPPALRSRAMGLLTVAIGTWPLGMLLAGGLAEGVGPLLATGALGVGGILWLGTTALRLVFAGRALRRRPG
jgi:hypothetical protein